MTDNREQYWSVDIPGLAKAQAEVLCGHARSEFHLPAATVEPDFFFTVHMDSHTVRSLVQAIETAQAALQDKSAWESLREDFAYWLEHQARDLPDDEI
jgi:hypothetical protein